MECGALTRMELVRASRKLLLHELRLFLARSSWHMMLSHNKGTQRRRPPKSFLRFNRVMHGSHIKCDSIVGVCLHFFCQVCIRLFPARLWDMIDHILCHRDPIFRSWWSSVRCGEL